MCIRSTALPPAGDGRKAAVSTQRRWAVNGRRGRLPGASEFHHKPSRPGGPVRRFVYSPVQMLNHWGLKIGHEPIPLLCKAQSLQASNLTVSPCFIFTWGPHVIALWRGGQTILVEGSLGTHFVDHLDSGGKNIHPVMTCPSWLLVIVCSEQIKGIAMYSHWIFLGILW